VGEIASRTLQLEDQALKMSVLATEPAEGGLADRKNPPNSEEFV